MSASKSQMANGGTEPAVNFDEELRAVALRGSQDALLTSRVRLDT